GVHEEGDLVTSWIHGDLDLELEVMLGPGGESGVLLQGRYEVQLADSRAVRTPQFADMGGIDAVRPDANGAFRDRLQGLPPHTNAARAPGLWQHLQVRFRAPHFDDTGRKTSNARFLEVRLNGV